MVESKASEKLSRLLISISIGDSVEHVRAISCHETDREMSSIPVYKAVEIAKEISDGLRR